ncbi:MAG: Crp/Fnr family transcriptional regulator [Bacteroidales bacterium]
MQKDLLSSLSSLLHQSDVMEIITQTATELGALLHLPKKTLLVKEGERLSHLYLLKEGAVKTYYHHEGSVVVTGFTFEREPIPIRFADKEMQTSAETVEVIEDVAVLKLPYAQIVEKVVTDHKISLMALAAVNHFLLLAQTRIDSFQAKNAKERYLHLMNTRPQLLNRVKLADIASYLGISQVSLSRIRAQI